MKSVDARETKSSSVSAESLNSGQPAQQAVVYLRVSTAQQGRSGLGIEAQREAVSNYLLTGGWTLLRELVEHESGAKNDRPALAEALRLCVITDAVLVIARLDRLSRSASFLLNLRDSGTPFIAVDMPDATPLTVGIMACVAQAERERIAANTKAALAAAKARGTRLGNPTRHIIGAERGPTAAAIVRMATANARATQVQPMIKELRAMGLSYAAVAARLKIDRVRTPRGGQWTGTAVRNALLRAAT